MEERLESMLFGSHYNDEHDELLGRSTFLKGVESGEVQNSLRRHCNVTDPGFKHTNNEHDLPQMDGIILDKMLK